MEKFENDKTKNIPTQHYEVLRELGDCHATVGNYVEAQDFYEKAASVGPDEAGPYIGLGVIALQKGFLDDAETAFKVAVRLDKASSKAYTGLGMIAQQRGNFQLAFDMYMKGLEFDSDNLTALLGLFQASSHIGSFEKVIGYLEIYLNMHPADRSVMFTLSALYMKDNKLEKSKRLLLNILALNSQDIEAAKLLEEVEYSLSKLSQPQNSQVR
jgi:tetratricopeptide (TPR) repeat protein